MNAEKKDQIMNAAVELFAVKGFEGTSVRELASKAGVNLAMINYYFGSKEKLFENIVECKAVNTREELEEIANDKELDEIGKIDKMVDNYVRRLFCNRYFHRVIHHELMLNQREELQNVIVTKLFPNSNIIKGVLEDGIKKGVFKKVDTELTIASLVGTINQVLLSKKFCNKMMSKPENYVPYDDEKFIKRVSDHIKSLMRSHILK